MPLSTGRNDLTTISSWRFDIKVLKFDVQWNPGVFEPVNDSKRSFGFNTSFVLYRFPQNRERGFHEGNKIYRLT